MSSHQSDYLLQQNSNNLNKSGYLVNNDDVSSSSDATTSGEGESSSVITTITNKLRDLDHIDKHNNNNNDNLNDSVASHDDSSSSNNSKNSIKNLNESDLEHLITNIINEHDMTGEKIKNIEHEEFIEATGADTSFNSEIDDVAPVVAASFKTSEDMNYVIIESEFDQSNLNKHPENDKDDNINRYVPVLDDSISSEDQMSKSGGISDVNEKSLADEEQDVVIHHDQIKHLDDSFIDNAHGSNDEKPQILNNESLNESNSSSTNEHDVSNQNNLEFDVRKQHSNLNDSYESEKVVEDLNQNDSYLNESSDKIVVENKNDSFQEEVVVEKIVNSFLNESNTTEEEQRENVSLNNNESLNESIQEEKVEIVKVARILNDSNVSEQNLDESVQEQEHVRIDSLNNSNASEDSRHENLHDIVAESIQEEVIQADSLENSNLSEENRHDNLNNIVAESIQEEIEEKNDSLNNSNASEDSRHEHLNNIVAESIQEEVVQVDLNTSNASEETHEQIVERVVNNLLNESNVSEEDSSSREQIVEVVHVELVNNKIDESLDESLNETKEEIIVEEVKQEESLQNNESVSSTNDIENEEKLHLNDSVVSSEPEHHGETKQVVELLEKSDESIENDPAPSAGENVQSQNQEQTTEKEEELFDKVIAELNNQINIANESVSDVSNVIDETRDGYINSYKLNENQYDLVNEFFRKHKNSSDLLNINLLRELMNENLKNREHLHATEDDVWRSLQTIDQDNDGYVNLDEFLSLLLLFYSSKQNLNERLNSVLKNMYHDKDEFSSIQSSKIGSFFDRFFGRFLEEDETQFDENLSLHDLVDRLSSRLEENAFVKW